jgi:hypothetical protein
MTTTKVTRAELYELVWRTPMSRLAAEFGVSDVALAKTCRRLSVPRPGRGYWAQIAVGRKVKRPGLGKPPPGTREWVIVERTENPAPRAPKPEVPKVETPTDLREAHEAIKRLGAALASAKRDQHDRLLIPGRRDPVLAVTVASHRRALLLLSALATVATSRGHAVVLHEEESSYVLAIVVEDAEIAASVIERLDRKAHELTPAERLQADRGYRYGIPKYDYFAAGRLQILLHESGASRSSWSDTERRSLERQLGSVVLAIEAVGERRRLQRIADEERRREQERRALAEAEERRLQRLREARVQHEERLARAWSEAEEIRRFLAAVRAAVPSSKSDGTAAWLRWADAYAVSLDPVSRADDIAKETELPEGSAE